jgi:acetyltransferase
LEIGEGSTLKIRSCDLMQKQESEVGRSTSTVRPSCGARHDDAHSGRERPSRSAARQVFCGADGSAPGTIELIIGIVEDPVFGPVVLFSHGGTAVELIQDTALAHAAAE